MPTSAAPDPFDVINVKLDTIIQRLLTTSTTTTPTPTPPPAEPETYKQQFMEKWGPLPEADFISRYNAGPPVPGTHIPVMSAYDEEEVIFRARFGFTWQGTTYTNFIKQADGTWVMDPDRRKAVEIIADATDATAKDSVHGYYTGYKSVAPDTAAYVFLAGYADTPAIFARKFGSLYQPSLWAGKSIQDIVEPSISMSHSPAGPGIG